MMGLGRGALHIRVGDHVGQLAGKGDDAVMVGRRGDAKAPEAAGGEQGMER